MVSTKKKVSKKLKKFKEHKKIREERWRRLGLPTLGKRQRSNFSIQGNVGN